MTKKLNRQFGRFLSLVLSVAMLVTGLPADLLGGIASVKADPVVKALDVGALITAGTLTKDAENVTQDIDATYSLIDIKKVKQTNQTFDDIKYTGALQCGSGSKTANAIKITAAKDGNLKMCVRGGSSSGSTITLEDSEGAKTTLNETALANSTNATYTTAVTAGTYYLYSKNTTYFYYVELTENEESGDGESNDGGDTPADGSTVAEGLIDFANAAEINVEGLSVENIAAISNSHGIQTKATDATMTLNLAKEATITVTTCRYGAGTEGTMTSSVGTVAKEEVDENGANGLVFTVTGASGKAVLTFASNMYIHSVKVEYAGATVAEGLIDFANAAEINVEGLSVENIAAISNSHGIQTKATDATMTLNLAKEATITVTTCRYGAGTEGTMTSSVGTVAKEEVDENGANGLVFTVTGASGKAVLTFASNMYIHSVKVEYAGATVAEGLIDFANAAEINVEGLSVENIAAISNSHGIQTKATDATMTLNLAKEATITVTTCRYGAGTEGTMTSSVGTVSKQEVDENGANGLVFTVTGASGKAVLTFASNMYIHNVKVEYAAEPVGPTIAAGSYNLSGLTEMTIEGISLKNIDTAGNKHGIETKATNATMNVNLEKAAKITVITCCYGAGANGTMISSSGTVSKEEVAEESGTGLKFTVINAEGNVALKFANQMWIHSISIEYVDLNGEPEGDLAKIDMWDFGAEQFTSDAAKYNVFLTEDLVNGLYTYTDDQKKGDNGRNIASFKLGDLSFNDGGYPTAHRWRTTNTNLTRWDEKSLKTADGTVLSGYIYSNKAATDTVYLQLDHVKAGDIITVYASSNGTNSDVVFENIMDSSWQETFTHEGGKPASVFVFHAPIAGSYKLYSATEKLVVGRITRERTAAVTVSGDVTIADGLADPVLVFTNDTTNATVEAQVSGGKYSTTLNEQYSYTVSVKDANGFVVSADSNTLTIAKDAGNTTHNVTIEKVPLQHITGTVTFDGVANADVLANAKLKLTATGENALYVPSFTVDAAAGTFAIDVEKGMTYKVSADGINDWEIKNDEWKAYTEDATGVEIAFTSKDLYEVTIAPEGATLEDLAGAKIVFVNLGEAGKGTAGDEGYTYSFVIGTDSIKLRNGVYSVVVGDKGSYGLFRQLLTSNLQVNGANVTKTIRFTDEPVTRWDFSSESWKNSEIKGEGNYQTLLLSNAAVNKVYCLAAKDSTIKIPVQAGKSKIKVDFCYSGTFTIGSTTDGEDASAVEFTADKSKGSTSASDTAEYEVEKEQPGYVIVKFSEQTYINYIEAMPPMAFKEVVTVDPSGKGDYTTINDALAAVKVMERTADQVVTISIVPGDYEEMLVITVPNIKLVNAAGSKASLDLKNGGVNIAKNAVRITSYYGHGYTYYSMGSDCKWNADILAANKENGYASFENPGSGTTAGSYWNATVVINANNVTAEGIIFENSFNQYVSKKAADDVIVAQSGAKEGAVPRASMKAGDTTVQQKKYVERAAALAIYGNCDKIYFDNCKFIGRQDTLYGGANSKVAFNKCSIYGGTDYIFGGMIAAFNKCDLVFNTYPSDANDVGYITAPQHGSGRGYVFYNCNVTSTTPGKDTISETVSNPGYFGRPWQAKTGEAVFVKTKVGVAADGSSLITPAGWLNTLSGESALCAEYDTFERSGVDNSAKRVAWSGGVLAEPKLADGTPLSFAAFLGDWNPFGTEMDFTIPSSHDGADEKTHAGEDGLHVELVDSDTEFVYTGKAIKPAIIVTNNGEELTEGVDYTVKYANNTNATTKKPATITVTGKGNLAGKQATTFQILPRDLSEVEVGSVVVASGSKATPILVFNGVKLTAKDFNNADAKTKYTADGEMNLTGKGNFTGELKVPVTVVAKADLKKFKVTVSKDKFTYNGDEQKPTSIKVTDAKSGVDLEEDQYMIVYPENTTSAGTVKFSVIGLGVYSGCVTKSYKIAPLKTTATVDASGINSDGYTFNANGVRLEAGTLVVTVGEETLVEGKDYTISYSANKKVGDAKYSFKFQGNYKGSKAAAGTFKIVPASLSELDADGLVQVAAIGKTVKKAGVYKTVPYVSANGTALKKSDMILTYYIDAEMTKEMAKATPVEVGGTVYVKIVGKGNYAAKDADDYLTAEYKVVNVDKTKDLSKAKIVDAKTGKKLSKQEYTGEEIKPEIKVMIGSTEVSSDAYEVAYVNNVNKGKATVIITAVDDNEGGYAGSKAQNFNIASRNLKNVVDFFKDLFS